MMCTLQLLTVSGDADKASKLFNKGKLKGQGPTSYIVIK